MNKIKRYFKVTIVVGIILIGVNYFFAHLAFNNVLTQYASTQIPQDSQLSFTSYFSFIPSPSIIIKNADYQIKKGTQVKIDKADAKVHFWQMLKTQALSIKEVSIQGLTLRLKQQAFDELLKKIVFQLIRESLGVSQFSNRPINKINLTDITLESVSHNGSVQKYHIEAIRNIGVKGQGVTACFANQEKAQSFYKTYLAKYMIAAKLQKECIVFNKSINPLPLGK